MNLHDPSALLEMYGITPTQQRMHILSFLLNHRTHPSAEEIFHSLRHDIPTLSRTTVYNTLKLFSEKGLVSELSLEENGLRYDIEVREHGHFKCRQCDCIYNFNVKPTGYEEDLRAFDIQNKEISFYGICPACLAGKSAPHI